MEFEKIKGNEELEAIVRKVINRLPKRSRKQRSMIALFTANGHNMEVGFDNSDPWMVCVIRDGKKNIVGTGASKRCTYADQADVPNETRGRDIAFTRALRRIPV